MLGSVLGPRDTIMSREQTQLCFHEVYSILGVGEEGKKTA